MAADEEMKLTKTGVIKFGSGKETTAKAPTPVKLL